MRVMRVMHVMRVMRVMHVRAAGSRLVLLGVKDRETLKVPRGNFMRPGKNSHFCRKTLKDSWIVFYLKIVKGKLNLSAQNL